MTEPTRDALHAETQWTAEWLLRESRRSGRALFEIEALEYAAACVRRVPELEAELDKWREREASVCPEDFGFEEVIKSLRSEVERLRAMEEDLRNEYVVECVRFVAAIDSGEVLNVERFYAASGAVRVLRRTNDGAGYAVVKAPTVLAAYAAAREEGTSDGN